MGIAGVNGVSNYPIYEKNGNMKRTANGDFNSKAAQSAGQCTRFTLYTGSPEDGKHLGSITGGGKSGMAVFKPNDFDPENPVYKVKVWDEEGNLTERMVDVSKVDVTKCDSADMYAYACYLSDSGQNPDAQDTFSRLQGYPNAHAQGGAFDRSVLEKVNWLSLAKNLMDMQYNAGNFQGYYAYKRFADCLSDERGSKYLSDEKVAVKKAGKPEDGSSKTNIIVKPDGSRVLVVTTNFGSMETSLSIKISEPTDMQNESNNENSSTQQGQTVEYMIGEAAEH